ncbi:MAG: UDP-N-acetylmuramoyl-tripeptide--D-alanyl-D-alanine ligase [Candidatus Moranbacteria bacterium]|jgi:UDP-N-acetylmuramoyl-tripeptide--D-alanyl-D-alanine ligase|nr:UDP-N-acetylmuramoyl-tripeptide--D-alanyl-D-alanine ligase [Candidatus Moranbacteria bacterium]
MAFNKRKILEKILCALARPVLRKYRPLVVGITGSVGKSSAKEAVALALSAGYTVRKAEGNYNNEIGIPLTIIGAKSGGRSLFRWVGVFFKWLFLMIFPTRYPQVLVLEMGIDRPGDMGFLLQFVSVNIGIVTQVSSSHLAYFGTLSNIAREKGKLIASLPSDGYAILNADDKRTLKMRDRTKAKVLTYGFDEGADVRADNFLLHREAKRAEGFSLKVNFDGTTVPLRLPKIVAKHHIPAALAAVSVAMALKMNLVDVVTALEAFEPLPGRLRLLPGRDNTFLLDDTYNASPESTRAALEVMGGLMAPRKIVVLGDMLELGPEAVKEHVGLAMAIRDSGAHIVVTVGKHMRALHERLLEEGFSRKQVLWMPDPLSAVEPLLNIIRSDDLILIKGSRGLRMEKITEQLLVDPRTAGSFLCCQSDDWRRKKFTSPAEWTEEA